MNKKLDYIFFFISHIYWTNFNYLINVITIFLFSVDKSEVCSKYDILQFLGPLTYYPQYIRINTPTTAQQQKWHCWNLVRI